MFVGWTVMTGGGPAPSHGLASIEPEITRSSADIAASRVRMGFFVNTLGDDKLFLCHPLKTVGQLEPERAAVLLDNVLGVKTGGRIIVFTIQNVVDTG